MARAATKAKKVEWLHVPEFEGLYEVSSLGEVRSLKRQTATGFLGGRTLSSDVGRNGYHRVTLSKKGVAKRFSVHRLVLLAFAGDAQGRETRHLNGDRADNRIENLAWGTRSENARDRSRHGTNPDRMGERHPNASLTDAQARDIIARRASGETARSIARDIGTSEQTVGRIANRKGWLHLEGARA